jgi:hypothetical protein
VADFASESMAEIKSECLADMRRNTHRWLSSTQLNARKNATFTKKERAPREARS